MPTRGECCGCRKAPVQRWRFNVYVEDVAARKQTTQLLCAECTTDLVARLIGHSVERTPQKELDDLKRIDEVTAAPQALHDDETEGVA